MDINSINNELLKLRSEVLQQEDKDKKIQMYEEILDKAGNCFNEYNKMLADGAKEFSKLTNTVYELADLSVRDPKECRRRLKALHKI